MRGWADFLQMELHRTRGFHPLRTLGGDADGSALVELTAILAHPCQACAETVEANWTQPNDCPHRVERTQTDPPVQARAG